MTYEGPERLRANGSSAPFKSANYSATDDVAGVLIYTHGCSVRVKFNIPAAQVIEALRRCGWSENPSPKIWKSFAPGTSVRRYVIRGSKWLNERAPSNAKLPLVGLNRQWKTRLYSLAIDRRGDEVHVDLQVIRHDDIRRFFEEVLGLQSRDYAIHYYRTIERFFVLPPHEALRFAMQLGSDPSDGRGRLGRKRRLVKDYDIPLSVRTRSKAMAMLVVYKIDRGATAAYKVEARLRGQRHDRGEFHESDIEKLDTVLLDFVKRHDLRTIPKPARWEPRTFTTAVERGSFDPYAKQIPQRAWRGSQVPKNLKALVQKCHTPSLVNLVVGDRDPVGFPGPPRIRCKLSSSKTINDETGSWKRVEGNGFEVSRYMFTESDREQVPDKCPPEKTNNAWTSITHHIARSSLYLHEVVLDPEESPRNLLRALADGPLGTVGIAAMCAVDASGHADTWLSVIQAANEHDFGRDGLDTLVIVIDPTAVLDVISALVGSVEPEIGHDGEVLGNLDGLLQPGPLIPHFPGMDLTPKVMGAWLADLFGELRRLGEETGIRVVVVTCDARPDHGLGNLLRSHFFRDGRVRSSIGDAGRYYTHQRYFVERAVKTTYRPSHTVVIEDGDDTIIQEYDEHAEHEYFPGRVVVLKDEAEGLVGRLIYDHVRHVAR